MEKLVKDIEVYVTDMHTGGMPVRIVTGGFPKMEGDTILQKIEYAREKMDYYRTLVMREPRGHLDQYGLFLVEPDLPEADVGAMFIHNDGYGTMCGHATIALGRYVVDNNLLKGKKMIENGIVEANIQCPCGLVKAQVEVNDGQSGRVSFLSVPAFLYKSDVTVNLPPFGSVTFDISYGGAFYVLVDAGQVGLDLSASSSGKLTEFAVMLLNYVKKNYDIKHSFEKDLSFLFGVILTDGKNDEDRSKTLCVFGVGELDRSPCGSGCTARIAAQFAKKQAKLNEVKTFQNATTGSEFTAEVMSEVTYAEYKAVQVKVSGHAFYTAKTTFVLEKKDAVRDGFLIQ